MFEEFNNKYIHFKDFLFDAYIHFIKTGTVSDSYINVYRRVGLFIRNDLLYIYFDLDNYGVEKKSIEQAEILDNLFLNTRHSD